MIYHLFENISSFWLLALVLGLVATILLKLSDAVSFVLNIWLSWKHPVKNLETGKPLPTIPYRFPNGQGDAAKFLDGEGNSLKWQREYGSLYRIWSGLTPEVVLTQSKHIYEAFKDSDRHIKAVNNNSGYLMSQILGQCVGLVSQDEWKRVRAVCERCFLRTVTGSYIENMERRTHRHFNNLWKDSKLSESIIDPAEDLKYLPFWIIAEIIYGELTSEMEQQLMDIAPRRELLFKHVIAGGIPRFTWSKYLPSSANRELHNFKTAWFSFNRSARDSSIKNSSNAALPQMYEAVDNKEISEEQLLQTLDEMLFANLDVTLGGISWNLVFLAAYPEVHARLRVEISTKRRVLEPSCFSNYLLSSSTYLASCISESSRLRPLAAFSVPQATPTGRCVGGYYFPANTNFIIDSYALNQRNPYWGENSSTFRPDRFLERSAIHNRYNFWRFGFGPRQCMGKYVADVMIRIILVHLVENFELGMIEENEEWKRDPEVWINHPQMQLRCKALGGRNYIEGH